MRLPLATTALVLMTAAAFAQGTTGTTTTGNPTTGTTTGTTMGTTPGTGAVAPMGTPSTPGAQIPAATMNSNTQSTNSPSPSAVQTNNTAARTAAAPVPGRNSFTMGEARRRITAAGFTSVKDLKKDDRGIWRGDAMKNGAPSKVALDYQGNVVGQ